MENLPLGKYQHYKGGEYLLLGVGRHTETLEEFVIYQALYDSAELGNQAIWIRPKNIFLETVEWNGQIVPRFKFLGK
jgi:cyclomaltodextrinase